MNKTAWITQDDFTNMIESLSKHRFNMIEQSILFEHDLSKKEHSEISREIKKITKLIEHTFKARELAREIDSR